MSPKELNIRVPWIRDGEDPSQWQERREEMRRKNEQIPEDIRQQVDELAEAELVRLHELRNLPADMPIFGSCHLIWRFKKEQFKALGYEWYTPKELNPGVMFD